jgi:hypothetical protein
MKNKKIETKETKRLQLNLIKTGVKAGYEKLARMGKRVELISFKD